MRFWLILICLFLFVIVLAPPSRPTLPSPTKKVVRILDRSSARDQYGPRTRPPVRKHKSSKPNRPRKTARPPFTG